MSNVANSSYEELPYPTKPVAMCHPDRLATIATLFGMQPPAIDRCRVLELGCGTGDNIIPMAERHPQSSFVGVDYSRAQIVQGQRLADALALANLELRHASFADLDEEPGSFDYIVCHGVFSWIPPELQDKTLALCRELLSPQGVACISYNVYPGWYFGSNIRQVLSGCASRGGSASECSADARAALKFLSTALAEQDATYAQLLRNQINAALPQPDGYLYHEYLESDNRPMYFHEFAARAASFSLQYLGDAELPTMFASSLGPTVEGRLHGLATDATSLEQHLDVLRNRAFRQTLLCHQGIPVTREVTFDRLVSLYVYGSVRARNDPPDLKAQVPELFDGSRKLTLSAALPLVKAALYHLGAQCPRAMRIDELILAAARLLDKGSAAEFSAAERANLGQTLVMCVLRGMIEPISAPDSFVTSISSRPQVSRLARVEALSSKVVTNRRHQPLRLDDSTLNILKYVDGQHGREALLREVAAALERGDVSLRVGGIPLTSDQAKTGVLDEALQKCLSVLASNALLVA